MNIRAVKSGQNVARRCRRGINVALAWISQSICQDFLPLSFSKRRQITSGIFYGQSSFYWARAEVAFMCEIFDFLFAVIVEHYITCVREIIKLLGKSKHLNEQASISFFNYMWKNHSMKCKTFHVRAHRYAYENKNVFGLKEWWVPLILAEHCVRTFCCCCSTARAVYIWNVCSFRRPTIADLRLKHSIWNSADIWWRLFTILIHTM